MLIYHHNSVVTPRNDVITRGCTMDADVELLPEVVSLSEEELRAYALDRALTIARATPGSSDWDDPEEWMLEGAELAHAVTRLLQRPGDAERLSYQIGLDRTLVDGGKRATDPTWFITAGPRLLESLERACDELERLAGLKKEG